MLGRKTYEIFAAHWPYAEGGDKDAIAKLFNNTTKYVATRKAMELTWTVRSRYMTQRRTWPG